MFNFILRHPKAVILSLIFHLLVGIGFWFGTQDHSEVVKLRMGQSAQVPNKISVQQIQPMKTFAVDSALVQQQLNKIKAEQARKLQAQKLLEAKSIRQKKYLTDLQKKQALAQKNTQREKRKAFKAKKQAEQEKRKADIAKRNAQEAKRLAEIEKKKVLAQKKRVKNEQLKAKKAQSEAKLAEQKRLEAQLKIKQAQQARLAIEAKKKAIEAEIKRQDTQKKQLEQEVLAARMKKEQQEAEASLQKAVAAEAAKRRQAEKAKQLLSLRETYISGIAARVKDNWKTAGKVDDRAQCVLSITQTPKGMISSVKVEKCNQYATTQFKKDAENAVYRSEPLPAPPVAELFERKVTFIFNP